MIDQDRIPVTRDAKDKHTTCCAIENGPTSLQRALWRADNILHTNRDHRFASHLMERESEVSSFLSL